MSKEPVNSIDDQKLRALISNFGFQNFESDILNQVEESIFAVAIRTDICKLSIGESRIGGVPDLPIGTSWPECDGEPLSFLGQFDLRSVALHDPGKRLPDVGFLYFFYDAEQSVWGYDPAHAGHWKVLFFDGPPSQLARAEFPAGLHKSARYRACKLALFKQPTLPESLKQHQQSKPIRGNNEDAYSDLREALGLSTTHHQLLGYSGNIQGEMELECQLVTNGVYAGDREGYQNPRVQTLREGAKDWMLLLQVDSDDEPGMMWGDLGRLYFWIRRQDLKARNFGNTWCILQCY